METLNDYLSGKTSFFTAINDVEVFPFIAGDEENLDLILKINYGQRTLFSPYKDVSINSLASLLVSEYGETWRDYVKIEALKDNVNERREISETISSNEDRLNEREDVNKVASFNSTEMVNNDGSTSTNTDANSGEKIRTMTDESISPQASYALLSNMARASILKNVMQDISKALTLAIY